MGTVNFNLPNKNITVISGELDTNGAYYTLAAGNKIYFSFTGHTATINLYSGTWDFTVDGSTASGVTIPDGFTQHALLTAGSDTTHTVVATLVSTTGITAFNRTSSVVVTSAGTPTLSPYTGFGPFYRYADISTLLALEGKWTESSNTRDVHSVHAGQGLSIKGTATAVRILTYTDLGTLVNLQVNRAAPVATVTYSGDGTYDLVSLATGLDNSTEKTFTIRTLKQGLNVGGLFFLGIMFVGGDVGSTPPAAVDLDVVYGDSIEALYLSTDPADEGLIEAGVANQQGCSSPPPRRLIAHRNPNSNLRIAHAHQTKHRRCPAAVPDGRFIRPHHRQDRPVAHGDDQQGRRRIRDAGRGGDGAERRLV
jgi:hypothetical protein